ncbi:MAG: alpha/beta hydrolase [Planctomycetes bacterium]|nr:alpha/beta hydrolase [Planctomycetota bacterium]
MPTLLLRPPDPAALLALAHGAGAGMRHAFMEALAGRLADRRIATLRYEFPYMQEGRRRPDPPKVAVAAVRDAVAEAAQHAGELPLFAGGKSFGGRMTSTAAAEAPLANVRGIVFFGFPLHPAGKPGTTRAKHLADVDVPMLFLQGTRDALADLDLLRPVCGGLGDRARLHIVNGADHGFHVLKRSGRTDDEVLDELADTAAAFMTSA